MNLTFPENLLIKNDDVQEQPNQDTDKLHGFSVSSLEVEESLEIDSWKRWKTRARMVDALTIVEAAAISFGIKPSAVQKLSDDSVPSAERFSFRLITILAAAQQGKIETTVGSVHSRVLTENDLIKFSNFVDFVKRGEKTSVHEDFIDLAFEVYESDEAMQKNFINLPWKEQAEVLAKQLLVEFGKDKPDQTKFFEMLYERCLENGLKTQRGGPPDKGTLRRRFFKEWWANENTW